MPLVSTGIKSKIIINKGDSDEFEVEAEFTEEGKMKFTFQVPVSPNARSLPDDYVLWLLGNAATDIISHQVNDIVNKNNKKINNG